MEKNLLEQLRSQALPDDNLSEKEQQLLRHLLNQELEKKLAAVLADKGVHRDPPRFRIRSSRLWRAAAAVLVAGVLGWWLLMSLQPKYRQMAAADLEQPFPLGEVTRVRRAGDDPQRVRTADDRQRDFSTQAYQRADYQLALDSVTPLLAEGRAEDHFLAGLSSLYLSRYKDAAGYLEKAKAIDPGLYSDEINWYLGLAYVMLDDLQKAKTSLNEVRNSKSSRDKGKAKALLDDLPK